MTTRAVERRRGMRCGLGLCVVEKLEARRLLSGSILQTTASLPDNQLMRFGNYAVVGNDVVFLQGDGPSGVSSEANAAIYNAASGQFTAISPPQPSSTLSQFSTAASVDQEALFTGAVNSQEQVSPVVDIYHTDTGQWTTAALSQARSFAAAVTIGQQVFFAGGYSGYGIGNYSSAVDIFNAATNQWTATAMPDAMPVVAGVAVGNDAVFVGPGEIQVYDTVGESWTPISMPPRLVPDTATDVLAVGSDVVVLGAAFYDNNMVRHVPNYAEVFNSTNDTFTFPTLPAAAFNLQGTAIDGQAYFLGVISSATSRHAGVNMACSFDPTTGKFNSMPAPPDYANSEAAATLGDKAVFFDRANGDSYGLIPFGNVFGAGIKVYDASDGTWADMSGPVSINEAIAIPSAQQVIAIPGFFDSVLGDSDVNVLQASNLPAPVLSSPANGATVNSRRPGFAWSALPGADSYTINFYGAGAPSPVTVNTTTYAPTAPLPAGLLGWDVTANVPGGGISSAHQTFTIAGPNLRAIIQAALPANITSATKLSVQVVLRNVGQLPSSGAFAVRIVVIDGDGQAVQIGQSTVASSLLVGAQMTLHIPVLFAKVPIGYVYSLATEVTTTKKSATARLQFWRGGWFEIAQAPAATAVPTTKQKVIRTAGGLLEDSD